MHFDKGSADQVREAKKEVIETLEKVLKEGFSDSEALLITIGKFTHLNLHIDLLRTWLSKYLDDKHPYVSNIITDETIEGYKAQIDDLTKELQGAGNSLEQIDSLKQQLEDTNKALQEQIDKNTLLERQSHAVEEVKVSNGNEPGTSVGTNGQQEQQQ